MPQNRTGSICAPELLLNSTPLATFTHMHSKTNEVSNGMDSSRSTPPTKLEVKSSMASASLSGSTLGVLLPVCLLAVFLSCVVCVYHWQSLRERRLDMEDERKRRKIIDDFDGGCALKTYKQTKNKVRMYPWKTVRIEDLPDINNNGEFNIPFSPGVNRGTDSCYGTIFPPSSAVEQLSARYERPNLRRIPIHSKVSDFTGELSGFSGSLEADLNLTSAPSRSEAATAKTCVFAPLKKASGPEYDVVHEEAIHLTHFDDDGQIVSVETMNGSLLEYWV
ncbi:uncharacterized protein LOC110069380 [Orbicella faveolata]|uniref:uncharacterized protein LOC110069380 n=1 Tax=Orbicella faveolata TaxID=48498 RepID=UPI0009E6392E|nr:uncharacterized protein LOC110069380 [Orbicella faveolata]